MKILSNSNKEDYLLGSSFYSCGGGVSINKASEILNQIGKFDIPIYSMYEFDENSLFCTVYAIGASGRGSKDYSRLIKAFDHLEDILGVVFDGIIPGEIGSEINAIYVAAHKNIPLVDTDMVGGRAVPEDHMDIHGIFNLPTTPVVITTNQSDLIFIKECPLSLKIEKISRLIAVESEGYAYLAGRTISNHDAKKIFPEGTVTRSLSTGSSLISVDTLKNFHCFVNNLEETTILGEGVIMSLEYIDSPGFLSGFINIISNVGVNYKVFFKNENLILWSNDKITYNAPDLISLINLSNYKPVSNSELRIGMKVIILGIKCVNQWSSPEARALMSPEKFGFFS